nr:type IVB secretion system protein IcmH/DotU [uncultured Massilia sp.]
MNPDDDFDPDRTVLLPTPGGRRAPPRPAEGATPAAQPDQGAARQQVALHGLGLNPLVRAANTLLDLVVPLRFVTAPPDMEMLRQRLVAEVQAFEVAARAAHADSETVAAARYALCTFLDETISSTPWGAGVWNSRSLLVAFHNEDWGGEKFFLVLQRLSQDARANLDVLELMYLCLALGLEGRYRVIDRGHDQLAVLRERLLELIRQHRGAHEQDLSPRWRGAEQAPPSMLRRVPPWVLAAVAGALLLVLHLAYAWMLNRASDPVFARLGALRVSPPVRNVVPVPAAAAPARLARFLAPEIAEGLVSVTETADRSVVTLRGDGVFASGSAEVPKRQEAVLVRIGDALGTVPGRVLVVGHTDDVRPALSARLPSNYDLSKARARTVAALLAERAGPASRYTAEGRGETEPLVPNDSAAHRARNRRVDIVVLAPPQPQ